jgi:hypothetical protein
VTKTVSIPKPPASNQPPSASIQQPANNASFTQGQSVTFQGTGTDPEQGALSGGALVWTSSRDGQIGTGNTFSTTALTVGAHTITLRVTDAQGAFGTATRNITITVPNQPPTAAIQQPANNSSFGQGQSVTFQGTGTDPEQGPLSGASLVWTSSRDGQIGTGTMFSTGSLSAGAHTVTLRVTDAQGATGTAAVNITINATNQSPTAAIQQPANNASFTQGQLITFQGTGTDPEQGPLGGNSLVWSSSIDGPIGTGTSFSNAGLSLGSHVITLTVTDAQGASGSAAVNIHVNPGTPPLVADFTIAYSVGLIPGTTITAGLATMDALPSSGGTQPYTYLWTNNDPWRGPGNQTSRVIVLPGSPGGTISFNLTLTVMDVNGNTASVTKVITIPKP